MPLYTLTLTNLNQEDVKNRKDQPFWGKTTLFLQLLMQNPGFQAAIKHLHIPWMGKQDVMWCLKQDFLY